MADSHAKHGPSYMAIFWYLAVLTVIEIGVIFAPLPRIVIGVLLVSLACAKAAMVAIYFMHLRFDSRIFRRLFVTGVLLATTVYIIVLLTFRVFIRS